MNTMTRKGYSAHVEFDERDSIFVGRVLGVRDTIGFHGATVDELRNRQRKRVDFVVHDTETDMNLTRVSLV